MNVDPHYDLAINRLGPVVRELLAAYGMDWAAIGTLHLAFAEAMRREIAVSGIEPYHRKDEG
jgi:hypothetical protein